MTATTTPDRSEDPRSRRKRGQLAVRPRRGAGVIGRATRWSLRAILIVVILVLLLVAILSALFRLGSPHIGIYKSEIQSWLSDYLQTPVEIGEMDFSWGGANPRITLQEVGLQSSGASDATGAGTDVESPVRFKQVWLDLNLPSTLFKRGWDINEVTIVGADLDLEYSGQRGFRVRGFDPVDGLSADQPLTQAKAEPSDDTGGASNMRQRSSRALSWLLAARNAALIDSSVTIQDGETGREYRLESINIRAENSDNRHQLNAEVLLPDGFGKSLELEADFVSEDGDVSRSSGKASLLGSAVDLETWLALLPERLIDFEGIANINIDGEWTGTKLNVVTADVTAPEIALQRNIEGSNELQLKNLDSRLEWLRTEEGWLATVPRFVFDEAGEQMRFDNTSLETVDRQEGRFWRVDAGGPRVNLELLGRFTDTFSSLLPMGNWPSLVENLKPEGELLEWQLSVDRGVRSSHQGGMPAVSINGSLENLRTRAYENLPQIEGLDMQVAIQDNAGKLKMSGSNVMFRQSQSFPVPLQLETVQGELDVAFDNTGITVSSDSVSVSDRGLSADVGFEYRRSLGESKVASTEASSGTELTGSERGWLNLNGTFNLQQANELHRYLPRARIQPWVAEWLENAIVAGQISNGQIQVEGDLRGFPFHRAEGQFESSMDMANVTLAYRPEWPVLEDATGKLAFSRKSMSIQLESGVLDEVDLTSADVQIKSLFRPVVSLDLRAADSVEHYLAFVRNSPLQSTFGPALADMRATANAKLRTRVNVPLRARRFREADEVFSVAGSLDFSGNRLASESYRTTLENVTGRLSFSHLGFEPGSLEAMYLGRPVVVETHSSGGVGNRLSEMVFAGIMDNRALAKEHNLPLQGIISGKSAWYVNIEIPHNPTVRNKRGVLLTATSNLKDAVVDLPLPMGKSRGRKKRLSVSSAFKSSGETPIWRVQLGREASALVASDASGEGLRALNIKLGGERLTGNPADGIRIDGRTDELSLDDWVVAIAQIVEATKGDGPAADLPLIQANLQTPQLFVGGKPQGKATVKVNSAGSHMNAVIENRRLRGSIRFPRTAETLGNPVNVRIANADRELLRGYMESNADDTAAQVEDEEPLDPREFPPLHVHLARLQWGERVLTDVVARTEPDSAGMKISTIGFANDSAQLSGEGVWHWRDPQNVNPAFRNQQVSRLDLQMRSGDVGRALDNFGVKSAMAKGKGTVDASIEWPGPVYAPSLQKLDGNLDFSLRRGRILSIEPGAARLFGLFALQSLPRRLSFDFSDITDEGLDYDSITGKLTIADGVANSDLVQLQGPVGVIDVTGSSNLVAQTFNQKVAVLPRISGALPIIGVISGGATAGIGALIAGPLLKAMGLDLDKIGLSEYTLQGSWDKPALRQVRGSTPVSLDNADRD